MTRKLRYYAKGGEPGTNLNNAHRRPMHSRDILAHFGLHPSAPIPPNYRDELMIGDTRVVILPAGRNVKTGKPTRRMLAVCNRCGQLVCAGHLHQHQQGEHCHQALS